MKTFKNLLIISLLTISGTAFTQNSNFEHEMTRWHKKVVITCGMIKEPKPDPAAIAANLEEMSRELAQLKLKYSGNAPEEYKNDPLWKSYFVDLDDNLTIVKYFADKQEYRIASKNCPIFCQTVGRMHRNNNTVDLADILFSLNMQMKLTTDISNAGNANGAKETTGQVKKLLEQASVKTVNSEDDKLKSLFPPVEKLVKEWIAAVESADVTGVKRIYASFLPEYQKLYHASME